MKQYLRQRLDSIDAAGNSKGWSALIWAATANHVKVVQMLMDAGANINLRDKQGASALHWAAALDNREILVFLCKSGAKLNMLDKVISGISFRPAALLP
jgi:ankyrin repeat protein